MKIIGYDIPGQIIYAMIVNGDGLFYNSASQEFIEPVAITNCTLAMTEKISGVYVVDVPEAIGAGNYTYACYRRLGLSPDPTDTMVSVGSFTIDASSVEVSFSEIAGDISDLNNISAADVKAQVDTALTDYDPPTSAEMEARTLLAADYFVVSDTVTLTGDYDAAKTAAQAGDAMALTEQERTTLSELIGSGGGGDYSAILAAIKAKTDRIGTGKATVNSAVTADKQVILVQGDSYSANSIPDRTLMWVEETWNIAETSTVVVIVHGYASFVAERLLATSVGLELSSADTLAMSVGNGRYSLQELTVDGQTISWVYNEPWVVKAQPTPAYTS